mgnify:CR=1 FL=1
MDITRWCAKQDSRRYLTVPFNYGARTFACNGHIMISIPSEHGYPEIQENLKSVMTGFLDTTGKTFVPWPSDLNLPEPTKCSTCKGTKKVKVTKCKECEGSCEVELENEFNSYSCQCKSCNGEGDIKSIGEGPSCYECLGFGDSFEPYAQTLLAGVRIYSKYARLLKSIGSVEISGGGDKLYFRSGEAQGVILGLA